MQWGIQLTISALARWFQRGLSIEYFLTWTTSSCFGGGGCSTFTFSVDDAVVSPFSAVSRRT